MPKTASHATGEDIERYTEGACHCLAVALHREFGWDIHLILDRGNLYWEDRFDSDNNVPAVIHAYALDNEGRAWDILGHRPVKEMRQEVNDWADIAKFGKETLTKEEDLRMYVGCWNDEDPDFPIDRPLDAYTDADIVRSLDDALRVFDGMLPERTLAMAR